MYTFYLVLHAYIHTCMSNKKSNRKQRHSKQMCTHFYTIYTSHPLLFFMPSMYTSPYSHCLQKPLSQLFCHPKFDEMKQASYILYLYVCGLQKESCPISSVTMWTKKQHVQDNYQSDPIITTRCCIQTGGLSAGFHVRGKVRIYQLD